jgi:hypothetical protein
MGGFLSENMMGKRIITGKQYRVCIGVLASLVVLIGMGGLARFTMRTARSAVENRRNQFRKGIVETDWDQHDLFI